MTYSLDLRKKVLQFLKRGHSVKEAAQVFEISIRSIMYWLQRERKESLAPKSRKSGAYKINEEHLKKYVAEHPDAYLREIAEAFKTTLQAVFYACKRLKITFKKNDLLQRKGRSEKAAIHRTCKRRYIRKSSIC